MAASCWISLASRVAVPVPRPAQNLWRTSWKGSGVGPGAGRLLKTYWRRLTMVARAGGYYGESFKGSRGVTQGDPLSPTIFNVVVDAVVRHWIEGLVTETEEKGEMGREGRHQLAVFYADDGMVVSSDPPGPRALSAPW